MISVIISSINDKLCAAVTENIAATIGVSYELVIIENKQGEFGLCEIYNQGAMQAQYDLLCFMHEDILIHTAEWGTKVSEILADTEIGLLGIIGAVYKSKAPSGIWCRTDEHINRGRYYCYNHKNERWLFERNPDNQQLSDVVAIDGLWMCTRKEVWEQHPFDAQTFTGFHMYDVDFSTQIFQTHRVCVTYDILMEHFSRGNWTRDWLDSVETYTKKWGACLPLSVDPLTSSQIAELEYRRFVRVSNFLINEKTRLKRGIYYAVRAIMAKPRELDNYKNLFSFVFGLQAVGGLVRIKHRFWPPKQSQQF